MSPTTRRLPPLVFSPQHNHPPPAGRDAFSALRLDVETDPALSRPADRAGTTATTATTTQCVELVFHNDWPWNPARTVSLHFLPSGDVVVARPLPLGLVPTPPNYVAEVAAPVRLYPRRRVRARVDGDSIESERSSWDENSIESERSSWDENSIESGRSSWDEQDDDDDDDDEEEVQWRKRRRTSKHAAKSWTEKQRGWGRRGWAILLAVVLVDMVLNGAFFRPSPKKRVPVTEDAEERAAVLEPLGVVGELAALAAWHAEVPMQVVDVVLGAGARTPVLHAVRAAERARESVADVLAAWHAMPRPGPDDVDVVARDMAGLLWSDTARALAAAADLAPETATGMAGWILPAASMAENVFRRLSEIAVRQPQLQDSIGDGLAGAAAHHVTNASAEAVLEVLGRHIGTVLRRTERYADRLYALQKQLGLAVPGLESMYGDFRNLFVDGGGDPAAADRWAAVRGHHSLRHHRWVDGQYHDAASPAAGLWQRASSALVGRAAGPAGGHHPTPEAEAALFLAAIAALRQCRDDLGALVGDHARLETRWRQLDGQISDLRAGRGWVRAAHDAAGRTGPDVRYYMPRLEPQLEELARVTRTLFVILHSVARRVRELEVQNTADQTAELQRQWEVQQGYWEQLRRELGRRAGGGASVEDVAGGEPDDDEGLRALTANWQLKVMDFVGAPDGQDGKGETATTVVASVLQPQRALRDG